MVFTRLVRADAGEHELLAEAPVVISSPRARRAPNLNSFDRFVFGLGSLFVPASRIPQLGSHPEAQNLVQIPRGASRNANIGGFFSSGGHRRPGQKGHRRNSLKRSSSSSAAIPVLAVPASHRRLRVPLASISTKTSSAACSRKHYRPGSRNDGPSWLSFIGHMRDSCESVDLVSQRIDTLAQPLVMVVMDVSTRRIIGFGVERADPQSTTFPISTWSRNSRVSSRSAVPRTDGHGYVLDRLDLFDLEYAVSGEPTMERK